jgi:hypothetical protein
MRRRKIHTLLIFVSLLAALPVTSAVASARVASDNDVQINGGAYNASMTLTSGGYAGIGTTSPANALDVNGSQAVGTYAGTASGASNKLIVGGKVGIGTTTPATGMKVDISRPVKAAGTGSEACTASDLGAMRYNSSGQYVEICTGP